MRFFYDFQRHLQEKKTLVKFWLCSWNKPDLVLLTRLKWFCLLGEFWSLVSILDLILTHKIYSGYGKEIGENEWPKGQSRRNSKKEMISKFSYMYQTQGSGLPSLTLLGMPREELQSCRMKEQPHLWSQDTGISISLADSAAETASGWERDQTLFSKVKCLYLFLFKVVSMFSPLRIALASQSFCDST